MTDPSPPPSGDTPSKLPFTVVSIARNEADLIGRYCDTIEKAFGKIGSAIDVIIVDTGSKDDTVALARSRGVTVYEHGDEFALYYSRQEARRVNQEIGEELVKPDQRVFQFDKGRNTADRYATTNWCLSMDICDIIEKANAPRLVAAVKAADATNKMYMTQIDKLRDELNGGPDRVKPTPEVKLTLNKQIDATKAKLIWGYTYTLRYGALIHKDPLVQSTSKLYDKSLLEARWRCMVHEVFAAEGAPRMLPKDLNGADSLIMRHAQRPDAVHNYLPGLLYGCLIRRGDSQHDQARLNYYLARELYYRSYKKPAIKMLEKAINNPYCWVKERSAACCHMAECYDKKEPNYIDKKRACYIRAIKLYPVWREPYLKLAEMAWTQEDYAGCIAYAEMAAKIHLAPGSPRFAEDAKNYSVAEPNRLMYIGYTRLAQKFMEAGEDCREILQRALDIEEAHNCGAQVNVFGWRLAYLAWLNHDKVVAKKYFDRCYMHDSKTFEADKHLFY